MTSVEHHKSKARLNIHVTESAQAHILSCLEKKPDFVVRLWVKKNGCSGLSYVMDYVMTPKQDDFCIPLSTQHLYVDKVSYPYLNNLKIDYIQQGLNRKMVYINPNQTGQCGCGESFTVD